MKKKFEENPNTPEKLKWLYTIRWTPESERVNDWMLPYLWSLVTKINNTEHKILEVGCGFGKTLSLISKKTNALLKGIDISCDAIEKGSKYYKSIIFECLDYEKSSDIELWDLIICSQVLEHVNNPLCMIDKMKQALKFNGKLFITVPWPNSNLDNGVKMHYWRFFSEDFKTLLPGCVIKKDLTRMVITWTK